MSIHDRAYRIRNWFIDIVSVNQYGDDGRLMMSNQEIDAVSSLLSPPIRLNRDEILEIISFLESLESYPLELVDLIVPDTVPSGLTIAQEKIESIRR